MTHGRCTLISRFTGIWCLTAIIGGSGCEKIPTFQDLTHTEQPSPALPPAAPPGASAKPAPPQQPTATTVVAPTIEDTQKVIFDFKKTSSDQRSDQLLARIANLSSGQDTFTEMDLRSSTVTDEGVKHLPKFPNLESVHLGNTKVTNAGLVFTLQLPKLTSLSLASCTVNRQMMETVSNSDRIEVLSLESSTVDDDGLVPIAQMPRLRELNLNSCRISDNAFKVLGTLKNLEVLRVAYTTINGSGMQFMKRKKSEVGLRVLDARRTRFGEQGLQYLKGVETLEELDVGEAEVSDRVLAQHLKGVTHLRKLSLAFNPISDAGTQVLGAIRSLEELNLSNTQRITGKTLSFLKGSKELRVLDLNSCGNITAQDIQALKKFLPGCEIRSPLANQ